MLRDWAIFFFCFSFVFFSLVAEPLQFQIQGEAAILMNGESGAILFEHDAYSERYPASTTKVATALYTLNQFGNKLEMLIEARQEALSTMSQEAKRKSNHPSFAYWLEPDGSHIAIKKGEILSLRHLLEGMLIPSGNDAANVIADALGPQIPIFMDKLNAYLKEIGCQKTHFCNPHGLHDPLHQTTAYDLALMTREALKYPVFCEMIAQTRFIRPKTNKQGAATFLQTNRLLRPGKFYYSKAMGVKTGYHAKAKKTFIGAAQLEGRKLIVVLLGYSDRQAILGDCIQLFEMAFNQPKVQRLFLKAGPQTFTLKLPHSNCPLHTYLPESLSLDYYPAEEPQVKCFLHWQSVDLPIKKDQQVGELRLVSPQGTVLKTVSLKASEEVKLAWPYRLLEMISSFPWLWILAGVLGVVILSALYNKYLA